MIFFRILLLNQLLTQYIILNTFPHDMTSHPMSAAGERVSSTQKPVPERQHHPQVTHTQMQKRFKRNFCTYVTCHVFNRTEWETGRKQNLILISFIFLPAAAALHLTTFFFFSIPANEFKQGQYSQVIILQVVGRGFWPRQSHWRGQIWPLRPFGGQNSLEEFA